ncbi:hypothetical protein CIW52_08555 [Mycolicibacterium sp. P9-64]|uniref:hypothetical protein n=1 Tax=Mycolicibacterium sp. P9-64 TaxID=2024612 RepID=UPI0011EE8A1E|nr:hypothetical protein [Mycolicibacterium sp. P9-64]KAA0084139.1 hypothetical protein CIW52_08555 [Mycolicibacterium sp. P9-64]
MTSHTSRYSGWRRAVTGAVASGALAAGLMAGLGSGTASADVLDDIAAQYDTGAGGGQVSELIHVALKMRAMGFVPSKGNMDDLVAAMDKRPNQVPLITALQKTVAFQKRNQARGIQQQAPVSIGINQYNPTNPSGTGLIPSGGGINIPLGP